MTSNIPLNSPVFLYGASKKGIEYLPIIQKRYKVIGFLDGNSKKHGTELCGFNISGPHSSQLLNKSSIIITSTFEAEISETLESMGIRNFVSVHALPDIERMYLKEKKKSQQKDISKRAATRSPLLVSVGSEGLANRGWLITEQSFLDITQSDDWSACFSPNSIDAIFAEHVWEHMTTTQAKVATKLCFRYLKYGGRLRLAVPDGYHESDSYIERVKPGGYGNGSDDHKVLYNYQSFSSLLEDVGFKVELLEYYDENRNLHTATISENFGAIRRSVYNYPDNHTDKLNYDYSSLIIDAFKCPN